MTISASPNLLRPFLFPQNPDRKEKVCQRRVCFIDFYGLFKVGTLVSLRWPLKSLNSSPNSIPNLSEKGRFETITTIPSMALSPLRSEQTC